MAIDVVCKAVDSAVKIASSASSLIREWKGVDLETDETLPTEPYGHIPLSVQLSEAH